jgi:hypothetical protein
MLQISQASKEKVLAAIQLGRIDAADISQPNFIDSIILKMNEIGVVDEFCHIIDDKRKDNAVIPMQFIWTLAISAKMKVHTSLTDVPYAIMDAEVLSELGYALWDTERDLEKGLITEGAIRYLLGKYKQEALITGYNNCVQRHILPKMGIESNLHILDCTKIEVELKIMSNPALSKKMVLRGGVINSQHCAESQATAG